MRQGLISSELLTCGVGVHSILLLPIVAIRIEAIDQGVSLAVAHSPVAIGNVGWLLESISMVSHWASGNAIDNIMVVR